MNVEGKQHVDTKHKLWSQNDYNIQRECERLRLIIIQLPLSSCYRKIPIFRFDFYSQSRIKSKESCKNTIEPKHMTHILCGSSNFSATINTRTHHSLSPESVLRLKRRDNSIQWLDTIANDDGMTLCRVLFSVWMMMMFLFLSNQKNLTHSQLNGATVKILYDNKFCVVVAFLFVFVCGGGNLVGGLSPQRDIIWLGSGIFFMKAINFTSQTNKKGLISNWSISDFTFPRLHTLTFMCALFAYHIFCCVHLLYTRAHNTQATLEYWVQ